MDVSRYFLKTTPRSILYSTKLGNSWIDYIKYEYTDEGYGEYLAKAKKWAQKNPASSKSRSKSKSKSKSPKRKSKSRSKSKSKSPKRKSKSRSKSKSKSPKRKKSKSKSKSPKRKSKSKSKSPKRTYKRIVSGKTRTIHQGPRGGRYYITKGRKVYLR